LDEFEDWSEWSISSEEFEEAWNLRQVEAGE
jgi:hypothetical protein